MQYTETFTAADGPLDTTDTDLVWSIVSGAGLAVANNVATINVASATRRVGRAEHVTDTVDQFAEADLTVPAAAYTDAEVALRMSSSAVTYYSGRVLYQSSQYSWEIKKNVAGTETVLAGRTAFTYTAPTRMRFTVQGTTLTLTLDGTQVASITDTSIDGVTVGGKRGGITFYRNASSGYASLDNFTFGDLVAAVSAGVTVAGGGSPTLTVSKAASAAVSVAGGGTPTVVGTRAVPGSGIFVAGGGTPTVVASRATSASATVAGGGSATPTGAKARSAGVVVAGGGAPTPTGRKEVTSGAVVAGGGGPSITTSGAVSATVTVGGGGTAASSGTKAARVGVVVAGGGEVVLDVYVPGGVAVVVGAGGGPTPTTFKVGQTSLAVGGDGAAVPIAVKSLLAAAEEIVDSREPARTWTAWEPAGLVTSSRGQTVIEAHRQTRKEEL